MRQDQYEKFNKFMNAIDEDFLLEAMADPAERKAEKAERKSIFAGASFKRWALRGGLVACCVLMVLATGKYINPSEDVAHATTLEEIEACGYDMSLPEGAEDVSYYWLDRESAEGAEASATDGSEDGSADVSDESNVEVSDVDIAQATFTIDGTEYTYRVLLGTEQTDLFVVLDDDTDQMVWTNNDLSISTENADDTSYVCWYDMNSQTQWCLASEGDDDVAMDAAYSILMTLGFDIGTAPEGSENVSYDILTVDALDSAKEPEAVDGITVTDLYFEYDGACCTYRIGVPLTVPEEVPDISETEGNYEITVDTSDESTWVGWCRTAIYYTPGGEGKIVWFDVVPGICYSLTVDNGASEDSLRSMAASLYTPMQTES
jgi:hypothetical protein